MNALKLILTFGALFMAGSISYALIAGGLFDEASILTLGKAFQDEVGLHLRRPPSFA